MFMRIFSGRGREILGRTIAEKILANHSGQPARAGDIVLADLDFIMGQDGTSPLAIDVFRQMGGVKVAEPSKAALVIDHNAPSPSEGVSALHDMMRGFSREMSVQIYDVGEGVCHQLVPEQGHVVPGDLVIGADSHTCTYGALNAFATGVGSTDLAAALYSGKMWFRVPPTMRVLCHGALAKGVTAKDLVLFLVGQIGADGATYMALEFAGEAISQLSVDARLTIANMAVEMGAKAGLMEADEKTLAWVAGRSARQPQPVQADADAEYEKVLEFDVSDLLPYVAVPHRVDTVVPVSAVEGKRIQQAVIGTCTNGRLEDLQQAARILAGKRIAEGVRLIVAPASRQILLDAIADGTIGQLVAAGAALVTPGCGPCVGTHNGIPADGETVISTANRNFKGRMGNNKAEIYLGSAATVAASALSGMITDPRRVADE
jgi:3-isopropylmalate/(R)-2-methylmalate dehydratase large subunit